MSLTRAVEVMQEMPLFRNIDPKQLRVVAMAAEERSYRAGERLFEKGDEGDAAYIVLDGEVEVRVPSDGTEQTVAVLGKGEIFGELAVICDQPRSSAIVARTDVVVLRLGRDIVLNLLRQFPDIALELLRILGARLERTTGNLSRALADRSSETGTDGGGAAGIGGDTRGDAGDNTGGDTGGDRS